MAVWWVPGDDATQRRAAIYIPGAADEHRMRQALSHCTQRGYHIIAVADGRTGLDCARRMMRRGDVDVIVTVPGGPPAGDGVEVAWQRGEEVAA